MEEQNNPETNSLEAPETTASSDDVKAASPALKKQVSHRIHGIISHFNVYMLLFIFIVIITTLLTFVSYNKQKKELNPSKTPVQELNTEALKQLQNSDTSIGDAKQTLTVESNAIFSGQVLARSNLDVAGTLKVGGALNLTGLIVSGDSTLDQLQANKLSVSGDTNIQGQLTVQKGLTISGGASFGAPISAPLLSVESLQLGGDLQFSKHIDAGGATPTRASGGALGSGGTVSVSGTDTAGTIAINIGSSPSAGCFVTLTFNKAFNATPHVTLGPVGSAAGNLRYYINRSSTGFSLCSNTAAAANSNFSFDYIVID